MKSSGDNLKVVGLEDGTVCATPDLITEQYVTSSVMIRINIITPLC